MAATRVLVVLVFLAIECAMAVTYSSRLIHRYYSDEVKAFRVSRSKGGGDWLEKRSLEYYQMLVSSDVQRQKMKLGPQSAFLFPSEGGQTMSLGKDFGCSPRGVPGKLNMNCSFEQPISNKVLLRNALSGLATSFVLLSQTNQVLGADLSCRHDLFGLANAADSVATLPLDATSEDGNGMLMMMRGMTAKNFDPVRYSGRWFEVASLKRGFAGQGQEDCHCTQGVYTFNADKPAIQVDTFCVHGGPDGYITGIRGNVQCLSEEDTEKNETDLEKREMIKEKCYLRFPTLPFIPKEPYDVIATDYYNFALVSGAKDRSFVQIYSRTPNPGPEFIEKYKVYLAEFGYDPSQIKDTPQDCEVMSNSKLAAMMSMSGMQQALTNQFPDLELKAPVAFDPFTSVLDTLKKLLQLYFK